MTEIVPIAAPETASLAAKTLQEGGLVAVPTETVYGLAADATNDRAVASIYEAKGRPSFNPLIIHVRDLEMAQRYGVFSPLAKKLAQHFWPGPLTIVVPAYKNNGLSSLVMAGLDTIAIRCPKAEITPAIFKEFDKPFAAPSANKSGSISPTLASHVAQSLGEKVELIIDGGACSVGVESTIIKVIGDEVSILRPGGISAEKLEAFLGQSLKQNPEQKIQAPGMMESHYAPNAKVILNIKEPSAQAAYLGFGAHRRETSIDRNLSQSGDLVEAAANLFKFMHELDTAADAIEVAPIPEEGLGIAINDRLRRAAAPR